ncbi:MULTISPECIES: hypothetical protein [unclassified Pseudomonas]|uniref:hypothetical protein n=1 Tax=unclassified Pseudomonas TaxID=196821 RepID=UPI0015B50769|nr:MULTISPECIES: hypothetical protein [unclassified Pseudomonas]
MSTTINASVLNAANADLTPNVKRAYAVAAALEAIAAKAAGGSDVNLKSEFFHLS